MSTEVSKVSTLAGKIIYVEKIDNFHHTLVSIGAIQMQLVLPYLRGTDGSCLLASC